MDKIGTVRICWTKHGYAGMFRLVGGRGQFVQKDGKRVYYPTMEQAGAGAGAALKAAHEAREKGRRNAKG